MSFPLQHAKGDQAAAQVMLLRPVRARVTAGQAQLILADSDDLLNWGTHAIPTTRLCGRQRQAVAGIVLLAISDHEHFEASSQPAAVGPVEMVPISPQGLAIEPAVCLQATDDRPRIVANPLQEAFGGIPGVKEHIVRTTMQAIVGIAEEI
jgi:hypothetical protein